MEEQEKTHKISYSKIKCLNTCRRQYMYKYVLGMKDVGNKYSRLGIAVHKHIEGVITGVIRTLPTMHADAQKEICRLRDGYRAGSVYVELPISHAFFENEQMFNFTGYIDAFEIVSAEEANIIDFKTGRAADFRNQLEVYAHVVFLNNPEIQKIKGIVLYTQNGISESYVFLRCDLQETLPFLLDAMREMCTLSEYPKNKTPMCFFCSYTQTCKAEKV